MKNAKEYEFIILCSNAFLEKEEKRRIKELLSGQLDWRIVIKVATKHRVVNLMYYNLCQLGLEHEINSKFLLMMRKIYHKADENNKMLRQEAVVISNELSKAGVNHAALKGIVLSSCVYPEFPIRTSSDIDFLIHISSKEKVMKVMKKCGFVQGEYEPESKKIKKFSREQMIFHQMSTHELLPFIKVIDKSVIIVDFNYTFIWKENCPFEIDMQEFLKHTITIDTPEGKICTLDLYRFMIHLSFHFYRECTFLNDIWAKKDMQLYKFADFCAVFEKYKDSIDWDGMLDLVEKMKIEKIIYFAFYYVNILNPHVIPSDILEKLEPSDTDYLNEYGEESGCVSQWKMEFPERLFNEDRVLELNRDIINDENNFFNTQEILKKTAN